MITGLQCKIPGTDVIDLMVKQISFHKERALVYKNQMEVLAGAGIEMTNMTGDPKAQAIASEKDHTKNAKELEFMLKYIDPTETYILSHYDLAELGVLKD